MRIVDVMPLQIPAVKVIRFARFRDARGYFTETYRASDVAAHAELSTLHGAPLVQFNESYSNRGVARGLHFQWNPHMGKLVRTVTGRMVDLFLDIRRGSPTLGKIAAHEMPADHDAEFAEWIWVPPGFAHGNFFAEPSLIEYGCTGEYSQGCEAAISLLDPGLDWSLCDPTLKKMWDENLSSPQLSLTEKDRNGYTLAAWLADPRSENFVHGPL